MKLKLTDTILLALMVAILMIGGHQTYVIAQTEGLKTGFLKSYWIFMFLMILIVIYQSRKNKRENSKEESVEKVIKGKSQKSSPQLKKKKK
jgi:amino acid permease